MKLILEKYTQKQFRTIKLHVETLHSQFESNAIREIRLSVKKLRALSAFLQVLLPKSAKVAVLMNPLTELYKILGNLRDAQVKRELLQQYRDKLSISVPTLTIALHHKMVKAEFNAFRFLKKAEIKGKKAFLERIAKAFNSIHEQKNGELIATEMLRLMASISKELTRNELKDEDYHDFRRSIKSILYMNRLIKKSEIEFPILINPEWCKPVEKSLGEWHDLVILRDFVLEFIHEQGSALAETEHTELQQLLQALHSDSFVLLNQFRFHFDALMVEIDDKF